MIFPGLAGFWISYAIFAYGFSQVRSCNAGFIDLIWPGRYKGCNPDGASGGPSQSTGIQGTPGSKTTPGSNPNNACPQGYVFCKGKCWRLGSLGASRCAQAA